MSDSVTLKVILNGTDENPWHKMNLKRNPFPQIPKAEYNEICHRISLLDADPIKSIEELVERLEGASEEFKTVCINNYVRGQRVQFLITIPKLVSDD